ncbi:Lactose transport system permease protein LacF [Rubrobacter xylanophilus DSM 9941]|uniref:carbohydrate ABC transporter permease n=1 Tax=Rubrobacter xylanophilus TaxID=49319 RepID=UPI001C63DCCA|nr:sugar ABC transporter permease [Rubrobacter xylanophilus]QYJ15234.1 Lactose transport system permease protein LacF [Rubrobacter xylanophilus DSM 9941]
MSVKTSGGKLRRRGLPITAYLFMLPTLVLVAVFFVVPVVLIGLISLTDMSSATGLRAPGFVGLENYRRILTHPSAAEIAWATVFYVAVTLVLFNVGLALLVALLTTHVPRRAGFFFRALWLLPRLTPVVVYISMWKYIAAPEPYGIINHHILVPLFGVQGANLLGDAPWVFVVVTNGLIGASFGMIIFTSAIESIPRDQMNAALVDGCGVWQRIRYVIIPWLKWPLLFVTTYQTLSLLTSFEYILVLTEGAYGTRVWSLWAYQVALSNYFGNFQYGFGSALAVMLVVVGIAASFVYLRFFRFGELVQEPKIEDQ